MMNLIDTSTNSPNYFSWKHIGITNENLNFVFRFKGLNVDASKRDKEKPESHNWNINYFSNIKCLSLKMLGTLLFRKFSTKNFAFALIIRPLAFDSDSRTLKLFSCFWKHLHSAPYGRVLVWVNFSLLMIKTIYSQKPL